MDEPIKDTKVIAVVGVDGVGKSTFIEHFLRQSSADAADALVITCPLYHKMENAPLARLSRALDAFSCAADELGSFSNKAAALFLQMTLFGPIEQFCRRTFAPPVILAERHPVVDTIAYGPFYVQMLRQAAGAVVEPSAIRAAVDEKLPGGFEEIERWHATQERRLAQCRELSGLSDLLLERLSAPPEQQLPFLYDNYQTRLPDVVIMLDASIDVIARRMQSRGSEGAELHESPEYLAQIRQSYLISLERLKSASPGIQVEIIDTDAINEVETVGRILVSCGLRQQRDEL